MSPTKYSFGKSSQEKLSTVSRCLRVVSEKALSYGVMDARVIEGARSREKQESLFAAGKSKLRWPNSKHNITVFGDVELARAVDIAPYVNGVVSWNAYHCTLWAGLMLAAASELGIKIRWGGNWDMDGEPITDQKFQDLVHFELLD